MVGIGAIHALQTQTLILTTNTVALRQWKTELLDKTKLEGAGPVLTAQNIHYEVAQRTAGIACGGLGMIHDMVQRLGLVDAINRSVALFKRYLPYSESDHVLNIAYNLLAGGTCL